MLSLLLMACEPLASPEPTPAASCPPGPGEVLRVETGQVHPSLSAAVRSGGPWITLCFGEGHFNADESIELEPGQVVRGRLTLRGVGDRTVLVSESIDPFSLVSEDDIRLESLQIQRHLGISASTLELIDVSVVALDTDNPGLNVFASELRIDGLHLSDNRSSSYLAVLNATSATVTDLSLLDNRTVRGPMALLQADSLQLQGLLVAGNQVLDDSAGTSLLELAGEGWVSDLQVRDNRSGGATLWSVGNQELSGVELLDNGSTWSPTLMVTGRSSLTGSTVTGNRSAAGIGLIYASNLLPLTLRDVDMSRASEEDPQLCDVYSTSRGCLEADLEQVDQLLCDANGCSPS